MPMSFGKKAKAGQTNFKAKVDKTKRAEPVCTASQPVADIRLCKKLLLQ